MNDWSLNLRKLKNLSTSVSCERTLSAAHWYNWELPILRGPSKFYRRIRCSFRRIILFEFILISEKEKSLTVISNQPAVESNKECFIEDGWIQRDEILIRWLIHILIILRFQRSKIKLVQRSRTLEFLVKMNTLLTVQRTRQRNLKVKNWSKGKSLKTSRIQRTRNRLNPSSRPRLKPKCHRRAVKWFQSRSNPTRLRVKRSR